MSPPELNTLSDRELVAVCKACIVGQETLEAHNTAVANFVLPHTGSEFNSWILARSRYMLCEKKEVWFKLY